MVLRSMNKSTNQDIHYFLKPIMLEQNQLCFPALCAADGSTFFFDSTLFCVFPVWRNAIILMTVIKNRFRSIVGVYSILHHHNELFNLYLSIKCFEI